MKSLRQQKWSRSKPYIVEFQQSILISFYYNSSRVNLILNFVCMVLPFDCLSVFSVVYLLQAVNPRISKLTTAAAEISANISWEYEGPEHGTFYVEYGVAGSKKQFHYPVFNWGLHFKKLRTFGGCTMDHLEKELDPNQWSRCIWKKLSEPSTYIYFICY